MFISYCQNAEKSYDMKIANKSFEYVTKLNPVKDSSNIVTFTKKLRTD
jgi:hypothetical protein